MSTNESPEQPEPDAADAPLDAPAATDAPTDAPHDAAPEQPVGLDADAANRELERTRREAAKYRTRVRELEEAEQARREAEMTELEKAQAESARLRAEADAAREHARTIATQAAVTAAAAKAQFADPADALAFIASQVEYDDAGTPTNVDELVRNLAAAKPHLVNPAPGASGGNPPRPGGSGAPQQTAADLLRDTLNPAGASWWGSSRTG